MKINRRGRFSDFYRGGGWFISWVTASGFFLIALRPKNWRFAYVRLPDRHCVRRLYVGPLEFELSQYGREG